MNNILNYVRASFNWSEDSFRFTPATGQWARENAIYIQEIGRFRTYPGYLTERRNLDSYLMVYTRRGWGRLSVDDKNYEISRGDLFWIDCHQEHVYQTVNEQGWDFDWVHFSGKGIYNYFDLFKRQISGNLVRHNSTECIIPRYFEELLNLQQTRGLAQELDSSRLLYCMMSEAILLQMRENVPGNNLHISVKQTIDYMENNLKEKIRLDDLSSNCNTDKYYLIKLFKEQTGLTPFEWLQKTRISRAKELLILSDSSVELIGESVGYSPASYFISVFRNCEKITPLNYRKHWQNTKN